MAIAVDEAFRTHRNLAVQGPTGVGKSIAYLIPAVMAAQRGERTVVVTSSKALQDQLAAVEIPFLQRSLGIPFEFAVLKGRSNYLCEAAASEIRVRIAAPGTTHSARLELGLGDESDPADLDLTDEATIEELSRIFEWVEQTETGDMAELTISPARRIWSAVSVGPGECVGAANCAHAKDCWSELARARAEEADIVVVNAHLYGAHLQMDRTLLPEHSHLIIDEAHDFEDSMVGSLGIELTSLRVKSFITRYRRCITGDDKTHGLLSDAAADLEECLNDTESGRLVEGLGPALSNAVEGITTGVDRAIGALRVAAGKTQASSVKHRLDTAIRAGESLSGDCASLLGELTPGKVLWVDESPTGWKSLQFSRIDVAATLSRLAWSDDDSPTVVCTSATLDSQTAGRLGVDARYLAVPSPFDFATNSVLYVPKINRPNHPDWPDDVVEVMEHLIRACGGRTLALFTSNRMLRTTVAACREKLPEFTILAQGDAPNPILHAQFMAEEHSCLFATASFWTGVSNPGTTCSAVIIDKLPFPVPVDPIVEARCEMVGDAAFMQVSVPAAAMQLAQGVGRLIRTTTDRGVVAVCDPRLAEARYRNRILDLLPPMRRARNRDFVDRFIADLELSQPDNSI